MSKRQITGFTVFRQKSQCGGCKTERAKRTDDVHQDIDIGEDAKSNIPIQRASTICEKNAIPAEATRTENAAIARRLECELSLSMSPIPDSNRAAGCEIAASIFVTMSEFNCPSLERDAAHATQRWVPSWKPTQGPAKNVLSV